MNGTTLNTKQNQNGTYEVHDEQNEINTLVTQGSDLLPALYNVYQEVTQANNLLDQTAQGTERAIQRYNNAETNRQWIIYNEVQKYNELMQKQNNLLSWVNNPEIKFWRYKDKLSYRTNSGQLIIDNHTEIQKELSSRYPENVCIVNDMNDALKNINQYRVNTVFIAINNIIVVEEEIFDCNNTFELLQYPNNIWKRNLLAYTRYNKKRKYQTSYEQKYSYIRLLMNHIVKNDLNVITDSISQWIGNIGTNLDTMLLLVGNKSLSEDLVVNKTINAIFDTDIVLTITDEILSKQSLEEIVSGKLFLHIGNIPESVENQQKLKELIVSVVINKSIQSDGYKVPTQAKIIVTIDEPDIFFEDFLEISTTLFIDSTKNILSKLQVNRTISLYQFIESSLDFYSNEINALNKGVINIRKDENKHYIELLSETSSNVEKSDGLPILDPYSDNFENLIPKGDYHTLITGLTRIGKSLLMLSLIMRYIFRKDCSIVLFDIHGDLAKKVVRLIKDKERLVYISPLLDTSYSPTINLFDIFDKSEKNIARVSQIILRVLKSIKTDESFSSPMEELLLHCIRVLLRKGGGSFIELYRFMNDKRNDDLIKYAKQSPNPLEEEYFTDYFASATATKDAVRRRLSTLLSDPLFSNLMNGTNTIDLEKEMNTPGKIIIIDIPKGEMETTYEYYIKFMLEYIQVLALKRVKTPKIEDRTLTHVFLDEAHNFITPNGNIETILTEAGKYNLYLTMANQAVSQYKTAKFQDIILSMTDAKIIGKNSNDTLTAMNKTLNTKLKDVENLAKGVFYASVANNDVVKFKNTDIFLNTDKEISDGQWQEHKQYQLSQYQRNINPEIKSKPTEDELKQMIHQFKSDIISKNLTESSCLYKLKTTAPERFTEIESDFEYRTIRDKEYRPRMRRPEISTIFKLAFELEDLIDNTDFTQMLKGDNAMFDKTDSGTRSKNFGGSSGSEQYYYFKQ